MNAPGQLVGKRILVFALLMSCIGSLAYACSFSPGPLHPVCRQVALIGMPGVLSAAVVTIALLSSHGGGPLWMLLVIATPVNFILYMVLGIAVKKLAGIFRKSAGA